MVGRNSKDTVKKVKQRLKEILETDFENCEKILKERMDIKLCGIFGFEGAFDIWVDAMWRSSTPDKKTFFVNIMVKDKRHIIITAEFKEVTTLRDMAAMAVAKCLDGQRDVEQLKDIPKSVYDDIKQFL